MSRPQRPDDGSAPRGPGRWWFQSSPGTSSLRALLNGREFRLLFQSRLVSYIGDSVSPIAVAFAVLEVGGSSADVGFALAARLVALVALVLVGGVLADRLSPVLVMILSDLIQCFAQAALATLLLTGHSSVGAIVATQILYGVGTAFHMPARNALVPLTVERDRLQAANSALFMAFGIAAIGAPAVGGFAIASLGAGIVVAMDAVTFAVSALILWYLRGTIPTGRVPAQAGVLSSFREGWAELRARPWVAVGIVYSGIYGAIFVAWISVLGPVTAVHWLGGGSATWGLVMSCVGIGVIGGAILAMKLAFDHPLKSGFSVLIFATPLMFAVGLRAPQWLVLITAVLAGVSIQWFGALWNTSLQAAVLPEFRARISSHDSVVSWSLRLLVYSVAGPIAAGAGFAAAWLCAGAILIALCVLPLLSPAVRGLTVPTTK